MKIQEQYFKKALFNTLTGAEAEALAEAREDIEFDKAFQEYLNTSTAIIQIEEKAAQGREEELAYRYAEEKTNAGENLYVEFRQHHDENFAALIGEAKATTTYMSRIGIKDVAPVISEAPEVKEKSYSNKTSVVAKEKQTASLRRLPGRRTRWLGIAVTALVLIFAGWWVSGTENRTTSKLDSLQADIGFLQYPESSGGGSLGGKNEQLDLKELPEKLSKLLEDQNFNAAVTLLDERIFNQTEHPEAIDEKLIRGLVQILTSSDLTKLDIRAATLQLIDLHEELWMKRFRKGGNAQSVSFQEALFDFERLFVRAYSSDERKEVAIETEALIKSERLDSEELAHAKALLNILR